MARPKGLPKTGGRKKGSTNKSSNDIKQMLSDLGTGEKAVRKLISLMDGSEVPHAVQRAAASDLLDREFGKAPQAITGADGGDLGLVIHKIERVIVDTSNPNATRIRPAPEAG